MKALIVILSKDAGSRGAEGLQYPLLPSGVNVRQNYLVLFIDKNL